MRTKIDKELIIMNARSVLIKNGYHIIERIKGKFDLLAVGYDVRVIRILLNNPSKRQIKNYIEDFPEIDGVRSEIWVPMPGMFKVFSKHGIGYITKYRHDY